MRRGIAAAATVAVIASGCGGTATLTAPSAKAPLTVSAPSGLCPASDKRPRRLLLPSATDVLVPGHPTSAVICRYWGFEEPDHENRTLAEARRITRQDVTSYLAGEMNALAPYPRHANCDEANADRSELFLFHYRNGSEARIVTSVGLCEPVGNGRTLRTGFGGKGTAEHWWDEGFV